MLMAAQHEVDSLIHEEIHDVGARVTAYSPFVRHGLCIPTTTHGTPASRAPSMALSVHS
jgi:hypothetical protein